MNSKNFKTAACTAFLKTLMMAFNLIFFLIGFCLVVVGFYGFRVFRQFFTFAPSTSIYFPVIAIGVFMMFVGALALWCTPKGTVWLLNVYSVLIFILFLSIFSVSILFAVKHDSWQSTLKNGIESSMEKYQNETQSIDVLQSSIKCCGSQNFTEWFNTSWAKGQNKVPKSCCIKKNSCINENLNVSNATDIYQIVKLPCFILFKKFDFFLFIGLFNQSKLDNPRKVFGNCWHWIRQFIYCPSWIAFDMSIGSKFK